MIGFVDSACSEMAEFTKPILFSLELNENSDEDFVDSFDAAFDAKTVSDCAAQSSGRAHGVSSSLSPSFDPLIAKGPRVEAKFELVVKTPLSPRRSYECDRFVILPPLRYGGGNGVSTTRRDGLILSLEKYVKLFTLQIMIPGEQDDEMGSRVDQANKKFPKAELSSSSLAPCGGRSIFSLSSGNEGLHVEDQWRQCMGTWGPPTPPSSQNDFDRGEL